MEQKKNKGGRPRVHEYVDLKVVEQMTALGHGIPAIAAKIGIGKRTLDRFIAERDDVREAYERGKSKGQGLALSALATSMKKGNVAAIIFYLVNKFPDEWQSISKGVQIANITNANGQMGQDVARDVQAGKLATELVMRLSKKLPNDNG